MKHWKKIQIPQLMQDNCKFTDSGLPVPYIVLEKNGEHLFKVNDNEKIINTINNKLCTICGTKLGDTAWFIGGPASAFHIHGAFNDGPVHKECGEYSLRVCPYLAYGKYNSKTDFEKIQKSLLEKNILAINNTVDSDRVPLFCFIGAKSWKITERLNYKPDNISEIEFWNDGEQLEKENAVQTIKTLFENKYGLENLVQF
jgi:hypothetical protein